MEYFVDYIIVIDKDKFCFCIVLKNMKYIDILEGD